jgi:rhamnogalacturonyl hydrolase YesR
MFSEWKIVGPRLIFLVITACIAVGWGHAEDIPSLLERVNDWQIVHPVMPPDDFCWERGTWYTGIMAAYKATGDKKFLTQALDWGRQRQYQLCFEKSTANMLFAVETWAQLSTIQNDSSMLGPSIAWFNQNVGIAPPGNKVWYMDGGTTGRRYVDALYAGAGLAMLAQATGDRKYLDYLHAFFWDVYAELFDKQAGLLRKYADISSIA